MAKSRGPVLILLAVLALAAAAYFGRQEETAGIGPPRRLFPSFDPGAVKSVRATRGAEEVRLTHGDGGWGVDEREGFPAEEEKLRRLLLDVASLEAVDRLTDDPAKYEALGVGEKPRQGLVEFRDGAGAVLARLYLGKPREARAVEGGGFAPSKGQYVRVEGDPAVYVAASVVNAETRPQAWLRQNLVRVSAEKIRSVEVRHGKAGDGFVLLREGKDGYRFADGPEGAVPDRMAAGRAFGTVTNLTAVEVLRRGDSLEASLRFDAVYRAVDASGAAYRAETARGPGGKCYARLSFATEGAAAGDASGRAAALEKLYGGRVLEIPPYLYDRLAMKRAELAGKK